jgi:hypothetical protein
MEWQQLTRWLRANPGRDPQDYLCASCTTAERNWKHGASESTLYGRWKGLFARVKGQGSEKTREENIKYYVNKGIKVCGEWYDFRNFQRWAVANGYARDLVLDRIDGNGDYSPKNCRWVSVAENNYNQERFKKNAIATREKPQGR